MELTELILQALKDHRPDGADCTCGTELLAYDGAHLDHQAHMVGAAIVPDLYEPAGNVFWPAQVG